MNTTLQWIEGERAEALRAAVMLDIGRARRTLSPDNPRLADLERRYSDLMRYVSTSVGPAS